MKNESKVGGRSSSRSVHATHDDSNNDKLAERKRNAPTHKKKGWVVGGTKKISINRSSAHHRYSLLYRRGGRKTEGGEGCLYFIRDNAPNGGTISKGEKKEGGFQNQERCCSVDQEENGKRELNFSSMGR